MSAEIKRIVNDKSVRDWTPDRSAPLWHPGIGQSDDAPFFHHLHLDHVKQVGPSCVPTTLSMVANSTGAVTTPDDFKPIINSQAPHTWSEALAPFGLKLAYCNNDLRRVGYYVDELIELDDLFFVCFYSHAPPSDPDSQGKLCTAHIVTVHRGVVYDTAKPKISGVVPLDEYTRLERQTKRIFRVVPLDYSRSL